VRLGDKLGNALTPRAAEPHAMGPRAMGDVA
jgi:hypothetical protein